MVALDPIKLARNQTERPLPRDPHETFAATSVATTRTAGKPAFTYHRLSDAGRRMHGRGHRLDQRRWIRIVLEWADTDDPAILYLG